MDTSKKEDKLIIRRSKSWLLFLIMGFVISALGSILFMMSSIQETPILAATIFCASVLGFVYYLVIFVKRRPVVTLTRQGISVAEDGFFSWDSIEKFSIENDSDIDQSYLVLQILPDREIRCVITNLDRKVDAVISKILEFSGKRTTFFCGFISV